MEMLHAVSLQAKALANMGSTDVVCLQQQDYLHAFRVQQQEQGGQGQPRCFPEQDMLFAFEEGGMVFGVTRPGIARSGIPLWTGESACPSLWSQAAHVPLAHDHTGAVHH